MAQPSAPAQATGGNCPGDWVNWESWEQPQSSLGDQGWIYWVQEGAPVSTGSNWCDWECPCAPLPWGELRLWGELPGTGRSWGALPGIWRSQGALPGIWRLWGELPGIWRSQGALPGIWRLCGEFPWLLEITGRAPLAFPHWRQLL